MLRGAVGGDEDVRNIDIALDSHKKGRNGRSQYKQRSLTVRSPMTSTGPFEQ